MDICLAAARLALVAVLAVGAARSVQAEESAGPGCTTSIVESGQSEAGPACTAIIEDPNATHEARVLALLMRGIWHYRAWRPQEAKRDIERGLELVPDHAKLLQLLASLHLDNGDDAKAEELARRSAEIDPNRSNTFEILATIARRKGELRVALGYLNRAVELRPDNAMAKYDRAQVLRKLNRASEALLDTSWLISQPTQNLDSAGMDFIDGRYVPLALASTIAHAEVLQSLERFEEAEAQFNAIVSNDRNAFTLTQRSLFLHGLPIGAGMKSRLQEAMTDAKEAVGLDARDARARRQYASTLEYARRHSEALAEIDVALELERREDGMPALLESRKAIARTRKAR